VSYSPILKDFEASPGLLGVDLDFHDFDYPELRHFECYLVELGLLVVTRPDFGLRLTAITSFHHLPVVSDEF
jgi:hypothetical protein